MLAELAPENLENLVTGLLDAWNTHDVERVVRYHSPDFQGTDVAEVGPAGIRQTFVRYFGAFPDLRFTRGETIIQGSRIALAWTARGTHLGAILNIPPTRRSVEIRGVSLLVVELTPSRLQATRASYLWDLAGLLRELGLLPDL